MINLDEILNNKEDFYNLALNSLKNIKENESIDLELSNLQKSLSILIEHEFIKTPCIKICIIINDKKTNQKKGNYYLYMTKEKEFIDEFLITK